MELFRWAVQGHLVCFPHLDRAPQKTTHAHAQVVFLQAKDGEDSHLWLLPLLRQHVCNKSLGFWGDAMLPVARSLIERAAALSGAQQAEVVQLRALEMQIWNLLPSFCIWPKDVGAAFRCIFPSGLLC